MLRSHLLTIVIIMSFLIAGCGEPSPGEQLAADIYVINQARLDEDLFAEILVEPYGAQEQSFDVVVPLALFIVFDGAQGLAQETPDEVRMINAAIGLWLLNIYRDENVDEKINTLTFQWFHPRTQETLIELEFAPDDRDALDLGVVEFTEEILDNAEDFILNATDYRDNFAHHHFEEVQEHYLERYERFMD